MARETKKDRFRRVAEKRVQNILNAVRSLSGLSNKKVYEWETGQLEKIWKAIEQEIVNCKKSFKESGSNLFKL